MGRSAALAMALLAPVGARGEDMVRVGPGVLRPLFAVRPDTPPRPVGAFLLDAAPVTRAEMEGFRGLPAGPRPPDAPATGVDYFSARAHCAARGARLPTEAEWELAARGPDETPAELPPFWQRDLGWAARPSGFAGPVRAGPPGPWGVHDLDGLVWEWVSDFTAAVVPAALQATDRGRPCGDLVLSAGDKREAAALARLQFRAKLTARTARPDLGFRCARDLTAPSAGPARVPGSVYDLDTHLLDQEGRRVGTDLYRGRPVVVALFYTACVGVCPMLISDVKRLARALDARTAAETRFLLISFDAARDTPEALRETAGRHDLDPDRWRLAAAPEADAVLLAAALEAKFRRLPDGGFAHTAVIAVLDRDGRLATRTEGAAPNPAPLVKRLRALAAAGRKNR